MARITLVIYDDEETGNTRLLGHFDPPVEEEDELTSAQVVAALMIDAATGLSRGLTTEEIGERWALGMDAGTDPAQGEN